MGFEQSNMSRDLNPDKPAQKYNKSSEDEVENPERRKVLGYLLKGAAFGIGAGLSVKAGGKVLEAFSEKKKMNADDITNERFNDISARLGTLENSSNSTKVNQKDFAYWKEELESLKKMDDKKDRITFLTRLSNLEKELSGVEK